MTNKMTNKKEDNKVIDHLDESWKEVITFLRNNKDVSGLEPLAFFTDTICKFRFDNLRRISAKTPPIFIHTTGELDMRTIPWKPCERSVIFIKKDKEAEIRVMSRVKDEDFVNEQTLKLIEDQSGNWKGRLRQLNSKGQYEKYEFDISRHGYVKSRTFKLTSLENRAKERPANNKKPRERAADKSLK